MPTALSTLLAMIAFAANSVLCRLALRDGAIDPAQFTVVRLVAGALVLWAIVRLRTPSAPGGGNWSSALALLAYAAGFSFAYVTLSTATGALLLFGAVQVTMIGAGWARGDRFLPIERAGFVLAAGGLAWLLLPGLDAPSPGGAAMMLAAGVAWGIYSLRGRGPGDPVRITAGNFLRAALLCTPLLLLVPERPLAPAGLWLAIASGALASGLGYAVWYSVLPELRATTAATVQLAVPLIAALAGVVLLGEPPTLRLAVAGIAILGGIGLVVRARARP